MQALISRPADQHRLIPTGCLLWYVDSYDVPKGFVAPTLGTQRLTSHLKVYRVGGLAEGIYVMWQLPDDADHLWAALLDPETRRYYHKHKGKLCAQPVYAEYLNGRHVHQYLALIGVCTSRALGLFAQAYGHRNINPCSGCERRYLQTYKPSNPDDQQSNPIHILWPFFECISLPSFQEGSCGNCLYHLEARQCTYVSQAQQSTVQGMRATRSSSLTLPPRQLCLVNCPIIHEYNGEEREQRCADAQEQELKARQEQYGYST